METSQMRIIRAVKRLKVIALGKGDMMRIFEDILDAYSLHDLKTLKAYLVFLSNCDEPYWRPRFQKYRVLGAFCEYLLAESVSEKAQLKYKLLLSLSEVHEIDRRIRKILLS